MRVIAEESNEPTTTPASADLEARAQSYECGWDQNTANRCTTKGGAISGRGNVRVLEVPHDGNPDTVLMMAMAMARR